MNEPDDMRNITQGSSNLDTVVSEVEAQISDLDSEILALQGNIQQLEQKKMRLRAFTAYYTNLKVPIFRLPSETLIEIFIRALPGAEVCIGCHRPSPENKLDIFQLSAVCYSWRSLLLSQPLLWSKVALSLLHLEARINSRMINNMYITSLARLNLCYGRSGDALMSLILEVVGPPLSCSEPSVKALLGRIAFGARRWESIDIRGALVDMPHHLGQVAYSNLRSLSFKNPFLGNINIGLDTFVPKAPNLSSISIDTMNDRSEQGLDLISQSDVFSSIGPQISDFKFALGGTIFLATASHLYNMIRRFPNLSTLKIHILPVLWGHMQAFTHTSSGLSPLLMPNLTSLHLIWGTSASRFSLCFFNLLPTGLRDLKLEIYGVPDQDTNLALLEWADHFSASLKNLLLMWSKPKMILLVIPLLRRFTQLSELNLRGPGIDHVLAALSEKENLGEVACAAPRLTRLVVYVREKDALLNLISVRALHQSPGTSKLEYARIHAPNALILGMKEVLLSTTLATNYAFRVEYEVDRRPWLNLGLDVPQIPTSPPPIWLLDLVQ